MTTLIRHCIMQSARLSYKKDAWLVLASINILCECGLGIKCDSLVFIFLGLTVVTVSKKIMDGYLAMYFHDIR